jgi:AraC family transcriptional regulator of adaptative response/methylated-DNA-[protein]-cysteine methyltransferase
VLLDGSERLTLEELAKRVGLSAGHLQRRFKARYGVSPRDLQDSRRRDRFRTALREGSGVSRATYDAGYGSSSRVYERAGQRLGMTPGQFARGGSGLVIRYTIVASPIARRLLVAVTDRGVCAVLPGPDDRALEAALAAEFPQAIRNRVDRGADSWLAGLVRRVAEEIEGDGEGGLSLDLKGTAFQERVWRALLEVPRGATRSYREIARALGRESSVRAVAGAIAKNRLAFVVPCHRVIRGDGSLAGYRWGLPLKERLLAAERASA